jgi:predicted amidohydrolase
VQAYARTHHCWVIFGLSRLAPDGVYNSALVIDRSGQIAGIYDKTHIQTHDKKFQPGAALPVFASDFGLFGVMICADRRWPETVRTLALKGARMLFNPTYGMHDERNLHMMQTRSFESEVFIAFAHPGQSLVTGPRGEVIYNNQDDGQCWTLCEVDLDQVNLVRSSQSGHLRDRRTDLYV